MKYRETVTFNSTEQDIIEKMIGCIRVINPVESQTRAVNRLLSGQATRGNLLESRAVGEQVLPVLRERMTYQADPKWIQQVREAEARGSVPLVADPDGMCKAIREAAEMQIGHIQQAIALIDLALEYLHNDWAKFEEEEEETIWSAIETLTA